MPPRRPLPDLCLISVFKVLTPNDQLKAAEMSPRCAILVRAANRPVKTLVITSLEYFHGEKTKDHLNSFSLSSKPIMHLLPAGGEPFPDYPMITTLLSKWNCLLVDYSSFLDQATVDQIVNIFSAVTDLKFDNVTCENLIALLQRPQWTYQLTSLGVFTFGIENYQPTEPRLVVAINALSALQCLAIQWSDTHDLPELTIISQLKVMALDLRDCCDDSSVAFLHSVEPHAERNVDLRMHLFGCYCSISLLAFSEPFCKRIVRYGNPYPLSAKEVPRVCRQFSSLTTLNIFCDEAPQLGALFTALSQLPLLVHLKLSLDLTRCEVANQLNEQQLQPFRPIAQLSSVRALELRLDITTHSQVQLLNLLVTMPRLQAIHITWFYCQSCGINLHWDLQSEWYKDKFNPRFSYFNSTLLECLGATLLLLHPGVPHDQIILDNEKPYRTLEQLLSTNQ